MSTDFSDLSLMQISDSFFPTGLYTMSNGLETLFSEKRITGMDELYELFRQTLYNKLVRVIALHFQMPMIILALMILKK